MGWGENGRAVDQVSTQVVSRCWDACVGVCKHLYLRSQCTSPELCKPGGANGWARYPG